jgi:hypothetical protein
MHARGGIQRHRKRVHAAEAVEGESKRQRYTTIRNLGHNHRGLSKGKCKVLRSRSDAEAFDAAIVVPQNGDAIHRRSDQLMAAHDGIRKVLQVSSRYTMTVN